MRCPFTYAAIFCCRIFRLPNFLLPIFRLPFFRWSFPFSLFQTVTLRCPVFLPSQFSLPNFLVAHFPIAFFPLPLFHTLILCCPVFLPSHFSLLIFPIAEFSGCPCFRCRFYLFRGNVITFNSFITPCFSKLSLFRGSVITFNSFITPCFSKLSEIYSSTEYHSDAVCIVLTD